MIFPTGQINTLQVGGNKKKKRKKNRLKQNKKTTNERYLREGVGVKHCYSFTACFVFLAEVFSNLFPIFEGHAAHSSGAVLGAINAVFVPAMTGHVREPIC
jgi:hypothetical protein